MAVNVLSWNEALKRGHEPRLYSYAAGDIPLGNVEATLDFKIWAQKVMGIGCYFTKMETGKKFLLTVYCHRSGAYKINGSAIDFSSCPTNELYQLIIRSDFKSGRIYFTVV
ncbi:MAG: hypothetical protein J0I32_23190 [Sphingobacteriales bacterium]|nr:hypothetical protein [Sphingobacteriales bacterium]OJW01947.1 MAG: hypothetical protein BGO52_00235 [Sphingobacteriales bacterium 44-61]